MARTVLTKTTPPGAYAGTSTAVTATAADVANGNSFPLVGGEIILIRNTDASPQTWTATSIANSIGRVEHITAESIAAGVVRVWGPAKLEGWRQTDGSFYLTASSALVTFTILSL